MSELAKNIEDQVAMGLNSLISESGISHELIESYVVIVINGLRSLHGEAIDAIDKALIVRRLEERFDITMSLGDLISSSEYKPWLNDARGSKDWFYWSRYKRYLSTNAYSPHVVRSLDAITDQILDHLENPEKLGTWARKGMVVGHVQSGKTANYTGLICKASDAGYKVIIVLAGMLNALRNQTQMRIDAGFIGKDSSRAMEVGNRPLSEQLVGVGSLDQSRFPASLTTTTHDFSIETAVRSNISLSALKEPLIFVIKKNKHSLENLARWLRNNNQHLQDYPMLLIDDEADNASVNTSADLADATTINEGIRKLLSLFSRSAYLGYTATPFANIFIDPESDAEMLGSDLFPRDFIIGLDPPTNYVGPEDIFGDDGGLTNSVREITDYETILPLKHKKDFPLNSLPASLEDAIRTFILVRVLRILRGQNTSHNSMLVNISRFTRVQSVTKLLILERLNTLRNAISISYLLNEAEALKNHEMGILFRLYEREFAGSGYCWADVQKHLKLAIDPVGVVEVNQSVNGERLDYSRRNYPNGRNVIAVGGLSLSRGLTLEGLTVSYFLRNSIMYDTLMQMGRWFGYRDGFKDLCRIYMPPEAVSWYAHISEVLDELRDDLRKMRLAGGTPQDFGLRVRSHPESLIVTARNKMRAGTKVSHQVDLAGSLVETTSVLLDNTTRKKNYQALLALLLSVRASGKKKPTAFDSSHYWTNVRSSIVLDFMDSYVNHPFSPKTDPGPLRNYIQWLSDTIEDWDVLLVSVDGKRDTKSVEIIDGVLVTPQYRNITEYTENWLRFRKGRVSSRGIESCGLTIAQVKEAQSQVGDKKSTPDREYRKYRRKPLLMLHLIDCRTKEGLSIVPDPVFAWGISFPMGSATGQRKVVEYVVNTVWWRNEFENMVAEDDEVDDE